MRYCVVFVLFYFLCSFVGVCAFRKGLVVLSNLHCSL